MSLPRQVLPGQFYLVTRRCTQRQFLLRPDRATNNAFTYCLLEAAQRCTISILVTCAMSNHHHTVIFDKHGRYPEFVEHFHKMLARSQNMLRGRRENFWSSEQVSVVKLVGREDVISKLVYAATNPVKDNLVDRVHHWPGVNGLSSLLNCRPMRAVRPRHFFRVRGPMPDKVETTLTIPTELGPAHEILDELRRRVREVELQAALSRQRNGQRVCGRRGVLRQAWSARPSTEEAPRGVKPRVAARSKWARIEALLRDRAFLASYARARAFLRDGLPAVFPVGTYWLRRFVHVPIAGELPAVEVRARIENWTSEQPAAAS